MKKLIEVKTHIGYFLENSIPEPYLFITIKNNYKKRNFCIDSIFIKDDINNQERTLWVKNLKRKLPFILNPGSTWETWVSSHQLKNNIEDLYDKVVIESYSKSKKLITFNSIKNLHVAPSGVIPDGSY